MTDKYYALTVILEKDIGEDSAQKIIDAIRMIKHVLDVKGNIADPVSLMAQIRERYEIRKKIFDVFHDREEK